ncbi:MAG TPA: MFS transporter [Caldilineae bacterium]|nr:MFS transporter [Caldilineae bacterium]
MGPQGFRAADGRRETLFHTYPRPIRFIRQLWLSLQVALTPPPTIPPQQAKPLQLLLFNGMLDSAGDYIALTFVPLLALTLGASYWQLGLLAGAASLSGAVGFLLASRLSALPRRITRGVTLSAIGLSRSTYLIIVVISLWLPPPTVLSMLISLWALRAFLSNLTYPLWVALAADLAPKHARGAYLHNRNDAMNVAAIIALPLAGAIIRSSETWGYPAGLTAAFLAGIAGFFLLIRTLHLSHGLTRTRWAATSRSSLDPRAYGRPFLIFCLIGFLWNLSLQITRPFLNVYLVVGLGATALGVGVLATISQLVSFASSHLITDVVRYRSPGWVMRMTSLLIPFIPWGWMLATASWHIAILNGISGILWVAYNMATMHTLMRLTPSRPGAAMTYQAMIFLSTSIGALAGGAMLEHMGFKPAFVISGAGRLLAALLLWSAPLSTVNEGSDHAERTGEGGESKR